MELPDQIKRIEALRDKAVSAYERSIALAEKHRKEADDYNIAIDVLTKIAPVSTATPSITPMPKPAFAGGGMPSAMPSQSGPIHQRILDFLKSQDRLWWTANQIQEALEAKGDVIKMTSISPNLSRLKDNNDIVRDDLKVALASRVPQNNDASEGDLLGGNPSEALNHTTSNQGGGEGPSKFVKPNWVGGT